VVRAAAEVAAGDPLRVRLAEGELAATVSASSELASPAVANEGPDTVTPS
jgi:ribosomal 50S subunit-recycling heat shock protein